jgi:UDP-glucose 4-epimerase
VLVTGGNGFIGRHTVSRLLLEGHDVAVLDWHGNPPIPGAELFLGDTRDASAVHEAMAHVDGFIHLAGVLGTQETINQPIPAVEINILGALNVLEAAAHYKVPGVFTGVGNHWMNNTYSITKTTVERFCAMYRDERKLPVSVVRCFNAYGPGQSIAAPFGSSKVRKITPSFVCRALLGEDIEVYGDGEQIMDMIYVGDIVHVLVTTLKYTIEEGPAPITLEAGTGRRTTVKEIAEFVLDSADSKSKVTHLPMRPGEPEHAVVLADTSTLDYLSIRSEDFVSLEEGTDWTVEWYRDNWLPGYQRSLEGAAL